MKKHKIHSIAALLTMLCLFSSFAMADVGAMAVGSGNSMGWATRGNQKMANSEALRFCNQNNQKKDCALISSKAIASAASNERISYAVSGLGAADAKKAALRLCGEAACKVDFALTTPGFFAIAQSKKLADGSTIFHFAYEFDDSEEANATALARCRERSGDECTFARVGVIPGTINKALPTSAPAAKRAEASCRPTTATVRCSSQCSNGDCTVTYENGCRMRVQVQPRFDGFLNQWTYPAPSC